MSLNRAAFGTVPRIVVALICAMPTGMCAAAVVECRDARGVTILSTSANGPACTDSASAARGVGRVMPAPHAQGPAGFPRVDGATQQSRDNDRVRILKDELGDEEGRLAALQARERPVGPSLLPADGSPSVAQRDVEVQLARARENIRALQRELAAMAPR